MGRTEAPYRELYRIPRTWQGQTAAFLTYGQVLQVQVALGQHCYCSEVPVSAGAALAPERGERPFSCTSVKNDETFSLGTAEGTYTVGDVESTGRKTILRSEASRDLLAQR